MMPETVEPEKLMEDWRVLLMVKMIEIMQENDTGFVPVVAPFRMEPADRMIVP